MVSIDFDRAKPQPLARDGENSAHAGLDSAPF